LAATTAVPVARGTVYFPRRGELGAIFGEVT
jgi:hypothetical protein